MRPLILALAVLLPSTLSAQPSERHYQQLEKRLRVDHPKGAIKKLSQPGPFGTTIIGAMVDAAYPGSGVIRVLVDPDDTSYGKNGDKTFADFARSRAWHRTPPPVEEFLKALNAAEYEGVLVLEAKGPLKTTPAGLLLRYTRLLPGPGNPKGTLQEILIPPTGDAIIRAPKK